MIYFPFTFPCQIGSSESEANFSPNRPYNFSIYDATFFPSVLYSAFILEVHVEIKMFSSHFFFSWVAQTLFHTYGMLLAMLAF